MNKLVPAAWPQAAAAPPQQAGRRPQCQQAREQSVPHLAVIEEAGRHVGNVPRHAKLHWQLDHGAGVQQGQALKQANVQVPALVP